MFFFLYGDTMRQNQHQNRMGWKVARAIDCRLLVCGVSVCGWGSLISFSCYNQLFKAREGTLMHVRTTRGLVQAVWMEVPWLDTLARGAKGKASGLGAQKRHCVISESPDDRDPGRFENECDF
jgi:hypothetical protein